MPKLRRTLSATPLARKHSRAHAARRIPWSAFDRAHYPDAALALAFRAQKRLALGEYGAVELFARLVGALTTNGAPLDLVAEAARAPLDELRHAEYALRFASLLGGREIEIPFDRDALAGPWKGPLDQEALDLLMLEVPAYTETLACALLSACLERAQDPIARAVFGALVADEVHHARLGWYYLAWRSPQWTRAERQRVADRAGDLVARTEKRFFGGCDAPKGTRAAARALGVLETEGQCEAVRAIMEDEIVPGLDALGLGASHAWKIRPRATRAEARAADDANTGA